MTKTVGHYGLHQDDEGVWYLVQGRGSTNAIGKRVRGDFSVDCPAGTHCNHQFNLSVLVPHDNHWGDFMHLIEDPLARTMLPFPKRERSAGAFLRDPHNEYWWLLLTLLRMGNPIDPCAHSIRKASPEWLELKMHSTNVQPLVITGFDLRSQVQLSRLAKAAASAPRSVIFVGNGDVSVPPELEEVTTQLHEDDLILLPLENLGSVALKKYMRGEWEAEVDGHRSDVIWVPKSQPENRVSA